MDEPVDLVRKRITNPCYACEPAKKGSYLSMTDVQMMEVILKTNRTAAMVLMIYYRKAYSRFKMHDDKAVGKLLLMSTKSVQTARLLLMKKGYFNWRKEGALFSYVLGSPAWVEEKKKRRKELKELRGCRGGDNENETDNIIKQLGAGNE